MIKAIIFDFDGVLVESVDVKTRAFARLFETYGPPVVQKVVEHHLAHGGMSRFEKIAYYYAAFLKKPLTREALDRLCARFAAMVVEEVVSAPLVEGAGSFLAENSIKYKLFVVSGTPQDELRIIVGRRGLDKYFEGVFGSPADKVLLTRRILERWDLQKDHVVFVGDSLTDYEAARNTGIRFLGRVPRNARNLFPHGTRIIRDLTELPGAILDLCATNKV